MFVWRYFCFYFIIKLEIINIWIYAPRLAAWRVTESDFPTVTDTRGGQFWAVILGQSPGNLNRPSFTVCLWQGEGRGLKTLKPPRIKTLVPFLRRAFIRNKDQTSGFHRSHHSEPPPDHPNTPHPHPHTPHHTTPPLGLLRELRACEQR